MTAELTEQELRQIREDGPGAVTAGTWDTLIDAALRDVRARGQKPVAWMVWSPMSGPAQFSTDPRTPVVAASRADYICDALYTTPQPTYRDGLLAALNCYSPDDLANDWADKIRALADKEPT